MKLQSDIGHFPSICGTCLNKNQYVLPNCLNNECACVRTHMRNRNAMHSLGAKLAHGYTASKCPSWYPIMKKSRSYCQTVTWLYCETVLQSSHVTAWHSWSYCPTHFWYVLCFTFLCLAGCSLADAARLLFIIGYRNRHLLAGQPCANLALRLCVLHCNYTVHICVCAHLSFGQFGRNQICLCQIKSREWQNKIGCAQTNCPHTFYI